MNLLRHGMGSHGNIANGSLQVCFRCFAKNQPAVDLKLLALGNFPSSPPERALCTDAFEFAVSKAAIIDPIAPGCGAYPDCRKRTSGEDQGEVNEGNFPPLPNAHKVFGCRLNGTD